MRPKLERFFFAGATPSRAASTRWLAARGRPTRRPCSPAGGSLEALLRAACCVIYARAGRVFAPVFVRGAQLTPTFPESALLRGLAERGSALDLERRGAPAPSAEDRGALGSLAPACCCRSVAGRS
jgi:hypothetical protein